MEKIIPKYNIDFKKEGQDHFFLHVKDRTDKSTTAFTDPHSHNYYCLNFLYKGKLPHFSDWDNSVISAPALLILDIDQVHIHTDLGDCQIISMAFSANFIHGQNKKIGDYIESVFSQTHIQFSTKELEELDKYLQLICLENNRGIDRNLEIIKCLLNVVLIQCAELSDKLAKKTYNKNNIFANFKNVLKKHYKSNRQVKFYADKLNVTTEMLTQVVKGACNKTPKQMIDERLLKEAKRLLYWSDITVREVAWELGFKTDGYFNRFFKKFEGQTPKDFQREVL